MVYPACASKKKQCIILLCLLLIIEVLDSYLHPSRFMFIPATIGIVWTVLTILSIPDPEPVKHPCTTTKEINRLVKENSEMCQMIHRMSEEHNLLCEIRSSLSHLRKSSNESLDMLYQINKLAKRACSIHRQTYNPEQEQKNSILPESSTALTKQDDKCVRFPESKVEYIDYEKVRIAFKQADSMLSGTSSEFSLSEEDCITNHLGYTKLQHTSISNTPRQNTTFSTSDLFSAARKGPLKRSNSFH